MSARAAVSKRAGSEKRDQVELWRSFVDSWKRVQRAAEKNLLTVEMTAAELRILRVLREHGSSPMHRFCAETMLSQPSITGVVDRLEERGYVERVRSSEDRREVLIAITPKGGEAYARTEEVHRRFVKKMLSALRDEEVESLTRLLRTLAEASDSAVSSPG